MKVLLVDDDTSLIQVLTRLLGTYHYTVDAVTDGETAWEYASSFDYDLIVLDVVLPDLDGVSLCQRLRSQGYTTPILLLTAQDNSTAKVLGLDAGADDYVVKPFDLAELTARIRALLRRGSNNLATVLTWGDLWLNPSTSEVTYAGLPLNLTSKEYALLELFLRESHHMFSIDEILESLWSSEEFPAEATVRSHIRRLRQRLIEAGAPSDLITTAHGRGYYLKPLMVSDLPTIEEESEESGKPAVREVDRQAQGLVQEAVQEVLQEVLEKDSQGDSHSIAPVDLQRQYLELLNQTWQADKAKQVQRLGLLEQTIIALRTQTLTGAQQVEASRIAHTLAGTLGTFGFTTAMQVAQQIEPLFQRPLPDLFREGDRLSELVALLRQELEPEQSIPMLQAKETHAQPGAGVSAYLFPHPSAHPSLHSSLHSSPHPSPHPSAQNSPFCLIVDEDIESAFSQSLISNASTYGMQAEIVASPAAVHSWLSRTATPDGHSPLPDAIAVKLPTSPATPQFLALLHNLTQTHPSLPMLILADQANLSQRLEVLRHGGKMFLPSSTPPDRVFAVVRQMLSDRPQGGTVLVVDDDPNWLRILPSLLKPWGFHVSTLEDPVQFWPLLESINPDLLVLDVKMPQVDGLELCQVLRSDPQWHQLPVLFLSVCTDPQIQQQAFRCGADDYVCKPITGVNLANRIRHRLDRVRSRLLPI
jgi:DNA-binding response OmpR family regulator/HPt (histidine-containing phosphotransfer) domain-containing protein